MATDCDPRIASTSAPVRPIDFMPAAKRAAAAIRITTLLKPSPAPLQKRFDVSPTSCLWTSPTTMPSAVPISMQTGTENVFVSSHPTCFEATTRRKSGITGMIAMMGLILKFAISRSVSVSSLTDPTPSFSIMEIAASTSAAIRIPSAAGSAS